MSSSKSSLGSSTPISSLPSSLQLLHQKQQEYTALQALREASEQLVARAEGMASMSATMADGGEAIGKVLENWNYVFTILESLGAATTKEEGEPLPMLVRMPYKGEDEKK